MRFIFLALLYITPSLSFATNCFPYSKNQTHPNNQHQVEAYQTQRQQCVFENKTLYTLRSFKLNGNSVSLTIDPETMSSNIIANACLSRCEPIDKQQLQNTYYGQQLSASKASPFPLQNDGITQGFGKKVALTIDMCPSSKGFSKDVYRAIEKRAQSQNKVIPVGVAMTRKWMQKWPQHFSELKALQAQGILAIEWINHSANHPYEHKVTLENNFLLSAKVDMVDEVLGNEIALIEAGVTPSGYFRFPGLVSNRSTMKFVSQHGLVTLGSNAWLAKDEQPDAGAIILIHGNLNEPLGGKKFIQYLAQMDTLGHEFGNLSEALNK